MKHIQIASIKKRLLSSLIDLTLIAGLSCLFYFCVFTKVVASVQHYDHLNEVINEERLDSQLYKRVGNKIITLIEEKPDAGRTELEDPIEDFYINYLFNKDEKYTDYWYDVHILHLNDKEELYTEEHLVQPEVVLFEWVNPIKGGGIVVQDKTGITDTQFNEFFRMTYSSALSNLQYVEPIFSALKTMTWGNIRAALYSSLIATFIPCFIIPISLKNGKTIGKLVTKLVVLTDEGYEYKRYKHIFRYLAFYVFEVFGGVVTIGLTLILTTSLTLFTKKKRALHDFVAFSVVIDEVNSVFYKDYDEELMYQKKSLEKLVS